MKHASAGMVACMSTELKSTFTPAINHICNTDGKINMLINPMIDFLNNDINAEQFENRLYRALEMCINNPTKKFSDVQLRYTVISTSEDNISVMSDIVTKVTNKVRNNYPELFAK